MRLAALLLAALLFGSSMALVTAQHRARSQFVELERLQLRARQLDTDADRLRIELARAAQPASVEAAARVLGMKRIEAGTTVFLPAPAAAAADAVQEKR
jgi:cell division protein FtsL